ncbi:MAG: sulfatase-like hydrolase/transferase [Victivallaceae bacterium]|nr:sulfatase-like hydrolase/transferase [Victivallaceae bacterium]
MNNKPNIVILFTDDQRFDMVNVIGDQNIITPNLNRLVAMGTTFTHAHIPGGTCPAVCMPSRAMLHSGRTLFHLENCGTSIPETDITLGETLRNNGYYSFGCGKWHNGGESFNRSFDDGAEIYFGGMCDHWNVPAYNFDPTGKYAKTIPRCPDPMGGKKVIQQPCDHISAGVHSSELLADCSVNFIREYDREQPFFLYTAFLAPHDPRVMPEEYLDMYDIDDIQLPENFMGAHPFNNGELHIRDEMLADFPRTPEEIREHIRDYYAMITHLDVQVGRILAALETKGVLENTIIIMAGDNGLAVGQHGLMGKQNLYEHSVRVPLICAGPGIPANNQSDAAVYLLDIYPTICDFLTIEPPDNVEGKSFAPAFQGKTTERDYLYLAYKDCQRGVSDLKHKLIEYVVDGKHSMTQLFDLKNDPCELNNMAGKPEYATKVAELRAQLFRMSREWDDQELDLGETFWQAIK